jgi:hypothetical protein
MRIRIILFSLIIAGISFGVGYIVGQREEPRDESTASTQKAEAPKKATAPAEELAITEVVDPSEKEVETDKVEITIQSETEMKARAEQALITFIDTKGRSLRAEIIQINPDSLTVRRQSDGKQLELPIAMLSERDKLFAAYLQETNDGDSAKKEADIQAILDELY